MNATTKHAAAGLAAAWQKFDAARSTLAVWVLALPPDGIDSDNASPLQVAMRAICELLNDARDGFDDAPGLGTFPGMAPLFACSLADMAHEALWNYMAGAEGAAAPVVADLAATVQQVLAHLADFERCHGATRGGAASPAAGVDGSAA